MQTSITTWLKKPAAVKQPIPITSDVSIPIPHLIRHPDHTQHVSSSTELQQRASTPSHEPQPVTEQDTNPTAEPLPEAEAQLQPSSPPHPKSASTFGTSTRPLVPNITLIPCSKPYVSSFQRLNTILLPIPYPQSFYKEILADPIAQDLTILAIWQDSPSTNTTTTTTTTTTTKTNPFSILSRNSEEKQGRVIAGIRCRILPSPDAPNGKLLYISTLGVLSPFRHYGIATHLLHAVIAKAVTRYEISAVGAHVWEASDDAREWYKKRGFRETHKEEGYYRKLKPQGAWVLRREVGVRDLL